MAKSSTNIASSTKKLIRVFLRMIPVLPGPELYDLVEDLRESRTEIDGKVRKAFASLQETSSLIGELEESLEERTDKLSHLKQEYERYSNLTEVEEKKARAIIQQLQLVIDRGKGSERWLSFLISVLAGLVVFFLGVWLSPVIKGWFGVN